MNIETLRKEFPQLQQTVYGKPLVYLDNAATALRCSSVIDKWNEMSVQFNSNLHRAVHRTAVLATDEFESTRSAVAHFINAASPSEIVFTSGTTQSVNLLAFCLGESFFKAGDEIIIGEAEHHSNLVPWQLLAQRKALKIKVLPLNDNGEYEIERLNDLLSPRTRLCCIAHVSNVLGIINPVKEICSICHANGTLVFVDGAQAVAHTSVDVADIACDFYAFSGHKMYAAPGTGVLYGRQDLLESFPPYMGGGEMIESVSWIQSSFAPVPHRFEAGTQNISGIHTLKPAIAIVKVMEDRQIQDNYTSIRNYLRIALEGIEGLRLFGAPADKERKTALFSFCIDGAHHEDLALILDKMGIALRSGQMCAEPLMDRYGVSGMLRASFAPYNTIGEAHYFVECLQRAIKMLKG